MEREKIDKVEKLDERKKKKQSKKKVRSKDIPEIFIEQRKDTVLETAELDKATSKVRDTVVVKSEGKAQSDRKDDFTEGSGFHPTTDEYERIQYTDDEDDSEYGGFDGEEEGDDDYDDSDDDDESGIEYEEDEVYDGDEEDKESDGIESVSSQSLQSETAIEDTDFLTIPPTEYNKPQKVSQFNFPIMDLPPDKNAIRRRRKDNGFAPSKKLQKIPKTIDEIDEESFTTRVSSRQSLITNQTIDDLDSRVSSRRSARSIASEILSQISGINSWLEGFKNKERDFLQIKTKSIKFLYFSSFFPFFFDL